MPRTATVEQTLARLAPIVGGLPVTRVVDLTPLDVLGIPVVGAVTPLARDLTTHQGKGVDVRAATASALMEAVERVTAEAAPWLGILASFDELQTRGRPALDPRAFDLPPDADYDERRAIHWLEGWDLLAHEPVLIARDLVVNPPDDGMLHEVDTNGLAAGNTILEAVLHGLCEVVERDAVGQALFLDLFAGGRGERAIGLEGLPPEIDRMLALVGGAGLELSAHDLTGDVAVPTIGCTLTDPAYPTPSGPRARAFLGHGTDPSKEVAVLRAVTEAVQARLAVVQGARDSYNSFPAAGPTSRPGGSGDPVPFAQLDTFDSDDLADDLSFVLDALRRAGFRHAVAVDLTRPDWCVPVVRVLVPGLSSFAVNRRRPGLRCLRHLM